MLHGLRLPGFGQPRVAVDSPELGLGRRFRTLDTFDVAEGCALECCTGYTTQRGYTITFINLFNRDGCFINEHLVRCNFHQDASCYMLVVRSSTAATNIVVQTAGMCENVRGTTSK